jgi:single-stranded-DNA-specific exonuclease
MAAPALSDIAPAWIVGKRDGQAEARLIRELEVPSLVAALLVQRGITEPTAAYTFLHPSLEDLQDARRLPDYEPARDAILAARESKELIYIHGDYDVDGVTSAAIFHRFLTKIGCRIHTHVPHRKEGYGINLDSVAEAASLGAKLFLTCDCGVAAHEQVEKAREAGMTVVVTDHHTVGKELPRAVAVVNPHRADSKYDFDELSGAGVVFRLCDGITRELGFPIAGYYRAFLDLAALGTIADVMPLVGENRVIARFGLAQLQATQKVGLKALMREAQVGQDADKAVKARDVGWQLGPRLNAAGRIEDAAKALQLLIETDEGAAKDLAHQLEQVNFERRSQTQRIFGEAEEMVLARGFEKRSLIMVAHPGWHPGIVGIVASRLVERFNRPCFVMTIDEAGGACKGSARSIPNFHLAEAIWAHPDLMHGGGHAMAAGCSFPVERLDQVRDALDAYAANVLTPEDFMPSVSADMEVTWDEVTLAATEGLKDLEPFGCANPEPTFYAKGVSICQVRPTRNPAHARLVLRQSEGPPFQGVAFGIGESLSEMGPGTRIDLLFRPEINEFRGDRELQWKVRDVRASDP